MRLVRRVYFLLTCFQAYVSLTAGLLVGGSALAASASPPPRARFALLLLAATFFAGTTANLVAAWRMRKGPTRWFWAASVLNLISFPLGTALGTVGLCLLTRKSFREADSSPLRTATAGGTGVRSSWLLQQLRGAVPFVVAAPFAAFGWHWASAAGLPSQPLWYWVICGELAFLASTLLHESSHVICGWLSDFRLMSFAVGPFHLEKPAGRWRLRYDVNSPAGPGEPRGMIPLHLRHIQTRALFYIAGGPAGSLLLAFLATLAFLTAPRAPWRDAWPFLQSVMAVSWAQALLNLLPVRAAGYSDCALLRQLRHRDWCEQFFSRSLAPPARETR